jgi:hypothetical protein
MSAINSGNRLGLDDILRNVGLAGGTRRLACASVLNRLIEPASEHATPASIRRTALADILGTIDGLAEDWSSASAACSISTGRSTSTI